MGARIGISAIVRREAASPDSPNATRAGITADIRVLWPPGTSQVDVMDVLAHAVVKAMREIDQSFKQEQS